MLLMWLVACSPDPIGQAPTPATECLAMPTDGQVFLPEDDAAHTEPVEWWYWTGHLTADDGRKFGFEEVFFSLTVQGISVGMNHVALTDNSAQRFDHLVTLEVGLPMVVDGGFQHSIGANTAIGGDGHDTLHAEPPGSVLDLTVDSLENPVLHNDVGYTDYDFGGYTYYYSRERMAASGTLAIGGETLNVSGIAWFDHQWGDLQQAVNVGWDWFALQLDDGRELMLFVSRPEGGVDVVGATLTEADCSSREIPGSEIVVTPLREWTSPETGCTYPVGWDVVAGDLHVVVTPVMDAQEIPDGNPTYWEGESTVSGDATGSAYVELTGYCTGQ